MSVLQDLTSHLFQGGHVDELTLVGTVVHLLHSVWVAVSTVECVVGHWLISGEKTMLFMGTGLDNTVLIDSMWMFCL